MVRVGYAVVLQALMLQTLVLEASVLEVLCHVLAEALQN